MQVIFVNDLANISKQDLIKIINEAYENGYAAGKKEGYYEGQIAIMNINNNNKNNNPYDWTKINCLDTIQ